MRRVTTAVAGGLIPLAFFLAPEAAAAPDEVCQSLDQNPTRLGLAVTARGLVDAYDISPYQAVQIIKGSVLARCPAHAGWIAAAIRSARP